MAALSAHAALRSQRCARCSTLVMAGSPRLLSATVQAERDIIASGMCQLLAWDTEEGAMVRALLRCTAQGCMDTRRELCTVGPGMSCVLRLWG